MSDAAPPCPPGTEHPVRPALPADVPQAAAVLAAAFAAYPWTSWITPEEGRASRLEQLFGLDLAEVALPHGEAWVAGCPATGAAVVGAVAVLRPDSEVPAEVWARVGSHEEALLGARTAAARDAEALCGPLRPVTAVLTVATVGVHPGHRRRGIGSALLRPPLELADRLGTRTYLETSTAGNLPFYERAGFDVTGSVEIPGGGPVVWAMVRPPGAAGPR